MKRRWVSDVVTLGVIVALLAATYLLPPDTSLKAVRDRGTLRVCIPESYPPLVTGDPSAPGIDIEILERVAAALDVRLQATVNPRIGRSFDPRSWRVTRAQCEIIAGGVIASLQTRSFLETTEPHMDTGWALLAPDFDSAPSLSTARVGFLPGTTGLDRIELSMFLRSQGATPSLFTTPAAATEAIATGAIDLLATEALQARALASPRGWESAFLPPPLERTPIAFGLWKGDLSLKRELASILSTLRRDGTIERIVASYELAPIRAECPVCG